MFIIVYVYKMYLGGLLGENPPNAEVRKEP